jgi:hypothetical protein
MAIELVCRVLSWCNRHGKTRPVVLEGSWGQVWPIVGRKDDPTSSGQTAFRPDLPGYPDPGRTPKEPQAPETVTPYVARCRGAAMARGAAVDRRHTFARVAASRGRGRGPPFEFHVNFKLIDWGGRRRGPL